MDNTLDPFQAYFRCQKFLNNGRRVVDAVSWTPLVWRVQMDEGTVAAKHQALAAVTSGLPSDVLLLERDLLNFLFEGKCHVPRWFGFDCQAYFTFCEWLGDETLDDLAQRNVAAARAFVQKIIIALKQIDILLNATSSRWEHRIISGGGKIDLLRSWDTATKKAKWGALALRRHLGLMSPPSQFFLAIDEVCASLAERTPQLGSSDYNARNIVISTDGDPYFIDFSKLNWDWTERRLVQYTTCMGSRLPGGRMRVLLDRHTVGETFCMTTIDAHQIIFLLNGVAALCSALEGKGQDCNQMLLRAWSQPKNRLFAFASALSASMSDDDKTCMIREAFEIN